MKKRLERPEGIIVTMPKRFFEEYGVDNFEREMHGLNDTSKTNVWYRVMKNLPAADCLYCYFCYDGKIQWRLNIGGTERNVTKQFGRPEGGIRTFENCNVLVLTGPAIKAPFEIPQKGFQGFRYTYHELW